MDKQEKTDLQSTMETAAAALKSIEPAARADYIIRLIKTLDGGHLDVEFSDTLIAIFLALSHRLSDERW